VGSRMGGRVRTRRTAYCRRMRFGQPFNTGTHAALSSGVLCAAAIGGITSMDAQAALSHVNVIPIMRMMALLATSDAGYRASSRPWAISGRCMIHACPLHPPALRRVDPARDQAHRVRAAPDRRAAHQAPVAPAPEAARSPAAGVVQTVLRRDDHPPAHRSKAGRCRSADALRRASKAALMSGSLIVGISRS
jgi:hypothetical protein